MNIYESIMQGLNEAVAYEQGKKTARSNTTQNLCKPIDLRDMEKEIRAISGMGEKRTEQVMTVIEKYLGDS